ncbi:MAG: putative porin [Candidatus Acidiferrales bacterium]
MLALGMGPAAAAQEPASEDDGASGVTKENLLAAVNRLSALVERQSRDLAAQRIAMREQQERMAVLERRLEHLTLASGLAPGVTVQPAVITGREAGSRTSASLAPAPTPAQQSDLAERVAKLEGSVAASQKTAESKLRQLGNFSFSGDLRLRYEPFFGGGVVTAPEPESRHRPRFRLRFNANAKFSDEWSGGLMLASGSDTDPISTNQTMDTFFERKPVNIDRAFLQYKPVWAKSLLRNSGELTMVGGKFGATWYRTEMVLDNDVNPEGLSEVLEFQIRTAALKRITLIGYQLPFNEVSAGPDSFLQGGQIQTHWDLGSRVRLSTYAAFYDWDRTDPVRAAQTLARLSGSTNQHSATATQFASKFGILDLIARFDVSTWSSRWPLMVQFDFATNTRACTNLVNIAAPQPACNPRDRHAHWAEIQLGQTREPGDINFGYTFLRIEREAVMGAFNYSDLRAPSNVAAHRLNFGYQTNRAVTLNFTGLFGRQLITPTSPEERFLSRLQMDLVYRF